MNEDRPARLVAVSERDELAMMAMAVMTLPSLVGSVDAILVLPGQGEWCRLRAAIAAWEANPSVKYLLVAGHTKTEDEYVELTLDILAEYGLKRRKGVIIEAHAWHSKEQADWLVPLVQELGIKSLALCVTSYHMLRAYLTMLAGFIRHGVGPIAMLPLPVPVSPDTISPLNGVSFLTLMPGEFNRIKIYQEKGDVATLAQLEDYLSWIWQQFTPLVNLAASVQ